MYGANQTRRAAGRTAAQAPAPTLRHLSVINNMGSITTHCTPSAITRQTSSRRRAFTVCRRCTKTYCGERHGHLLSAACWLSAASVSRMVTRGAKQQRWRRQRNVAGGLLRSDGRGGCNIPLLRPAYGVLLATAFLGEKRDETGQHISAMPYGASISMDEELVGLSVRKGPGGRRCVNHSRMYCWFGRAYPPRRLEKWMWRSWPGANLGISCWRRHTTRSASSSVC